MSETGSSFTLTECGSLSSNGTGSGNAIEGTYTSNVTGTDNYTMHEHGTNAESQSFCQSITGTDNFTISETGNQANGTDTRTISGSGSYTEFEAVADGPSTPSGSYSLDNSEAADATSGALAQSGGVGRYALLTDFVDVSNADASSPGNMNFSPEGQAFVDPASGSPGDQAPNGAYQAGQQEGQTPPYRIPRFDPTPQPYPFPQHDPGDIFRSWMERQQGGTDPPPIIELEPRPRMGQLLPLLPPAPPGAQILDRFTWRKPWLNLVTGAIWTITVAPGSITITRDGRRLGRQTIEISPEHIPRVLRNIELFPNSPHRWMDGAGTLGIFRWMW